MARAGSRIVTEQQAGQPPSMDVYFATPAQYVPLLKQNPFQPVEWDELMPERISKVMVEADGLVVKGLTGLPGVSYNKPMIPNLPTSLMDFLRPEWKGKIASTPYAASFDVLTATDVWGADRTIDYAMKLVPQLAGLMGCGEEQRIASGEYVALVMDCEGSSSTRYQRLGAPVDHLIASDAAVLRYFYFSVPKNVQSPNAAKLFITYLLTAQGQKAMWDLYGMDLDLFPGSHAGAVIAAQKKQGTSFKEATVTWWMQHPEIDGATGKVVKILAGASGNK
jgi:ABC-type Fe3+ transport system substrate-binding protein